MTEQSCLKNKYFLDIQLKPQRHISPKQHLKQNLQIYIRCLGKAFMAFRNLNTRCFKGNHQKEYSKLCLNNIISTILLLYNIQSPLRHHFSHLVREMNMILRVMTSEFVLNSGMLFYSFYFCLLIFQMLQKRTLLFTLSSIHSWSTLYPSELDLLLQLRNKY